MLTPILALVCWTFVVWLWMYVTRIPAMKAAGIDPQDAAFSGGDSPMNKLPDSARGVADNYNHLHEQPTVFYALVAYTYLAGTTDALNIQLAWAYVGLRVVHSLIQCTFNHVISRYIAYKLSALVLLALAIRNVLALL